MQIVSFFVYFCFIEHVLVRALQLLGVTMTRETLVKIERGIQHIQASQLRGIRDALETTYDELLKS